MKILLLGGTGAMGSHLSNILSTDVNNIIFITSRKPRISIDNKKYVCGNAHDEVFFKSVLNEKWDVIVDFMVYNTAEFKSRVNYILDSCKQYVFLSSSRVYADSKTPLTEQSSRLLDVCNDEEYQNTDEYALTKARQENILRESGRNNYTIIRPYITFAENRLQLGVLELQHWLYRALLGNSIVFSEDIAQKYTTLTYGYDVARGIASITGNNKAFGKAFHITVSNSIKWIDILKIYRDVIESETGKRPSVKMVKEHPYINDKNRRYQVIFDRRYNRKFDNSAISEFIDTSSFLSTEEGIRKSLSTFIHNNREFSFSLDPYHEGFYDRITGEQTSLAYFNDIKSKVKYLVSRYFPKQLHLFRIVRKFLK